MFQNIGYKFGHFFENFVSTIGPFLDGRLDGEMPYQYTEYAHEHRLLNQAYRVILSRLPAQ